MKTKLSFVLCIVLMSWPLFGSTQSYTTFGNVDCGQWVKGNRPTDRTWLLGYLTGMNSDPSNKNFLKKLNSAEQAFLFVDNYCKNNPLKKVIDGAESLFDELSVSK